MPSPSELTVGIVIAELILAPMIASIAIIFLIIRNEIE